MILLQACNKELILLSSLSFCFGNYAILIHLFQQTLDFLSHTLAVLADTVSHLLFLPRELSYSCCFEKKPTLRSGYLEGTQNVNESLVSVST